MFFDFRYMYLLLPAMLISLWAQIKVKSTFAKYSKVRSNNGYTGEQVARMLLDSSGLHNIPIEIVRGKLTDHYDPINKVMRLSEEVYYGSSVASIGVAAHETGHAIQHKENYSPLMMRNSIAPVVSFSSNVSWILFFIGFIFSFTPLISIGIILFSLVVLFQLITLPVEFNASNRALHILDNRGVLVGNELKGAKSVLTAAAMTYVAAAITAIVELIRLILISRDN